MPRTARIKSENGIYYVILARNCKRKRQIYPPDGTFDRKAKGRIEPVEIKQEKRAVPVPLLKMKF